MQPFSTVQVFPLVETYAVMEILIVSYMACESFSATLPVTKAILQA